MYLHSTNNRDRVLIKDLPLLIWQIVNHFQERDLQIFLPADHRKTTSVLKITLVKPEVSFQVPLQVLKVYSKKDWHYRFQF